MKIQETTHGIPVPNIIGTVRLGELGIEELGQLLQSAYDRGLSDFDNHVDMPPNPLTGKYNITHAEVADALAATEDIELVRSDGTLTTAGQWYVADMRRDAGSGHFRVIPGSCNTGFLFSPV